MVALRVAARAVQGVWVRKIKVSVSLKTSTKTVSGSEIVKL